MGQSIELLGVRLLVPVGLLCVHEKDLREGGCVAPPWHDRAYPAVFIHRPRRRQIGQHALP